MVNIIVCLVIGAIIVSSAGYIIIQKKKGVKCIGCSSEKKCSSNCRCSK